MWAAFPAAVVAGAMAAGGSADALTLSWQGGSPNYSAPLNASTRVNVISTVPSKSYNGYGVGFNVTDGVKDFLAWCVDINHYINLASEYEITTTPYQNQPGVVLTAGQQTDLNRLFNTAYGGLDPTVGVQAAAFQLAIWEIAFETVGAGYNIVAGAFRSVWGTANVSGQNNAAVSLADTFLKNLYKGTQTPQLLTYYEATPYPNSEDHSQNLVTATAGGGIIPPVPLPGAAWMLGVGLFGLYGASRRKKA